MPSGPKKRKAAKRRDQMRKQDSSSNPIPDPNPSSQENEKEKSLVEIEEDEGEEIFKTPRSQPEMPMFVFEPNSVYFSIGSVNNERRNEIEGLSEVISKGLDLGMVFEDAEPIIAVTENSIGSVLLDGPSMEREENLEPEVFTEETRHKFSSLNDNELKVFVNSEKMGDGLESGIYKDDEVQKETKLDFEMPFKDAKDDAGSKEAELDEFVHVIKEESSIERVEKLGTEEDCPPIEQFVLLDEEMTPKTSIEVVDVSSSNEKEVKVVPWLDEELHTDNGDADINVDVINYGKGGDDEGNQSLEKEIDEDDLLVETTLDESGHDIEKQSMLETDESLRSEEQSVPWDDEMTPKVSSEAVDVSTPNERVVKVVSWLLSDNGDADVNVDIVNYEKGGDDDSEVLERQFNKDVLKETKLDECVHDIEKESKFEIEVCLRSVEQSAPWDEEMTDKALSGVVDVSLSNEREVKAVPWQDEELFSDNGDAYVNVDVNPEKRGDNDGDDSVEREFDKDVKGLEEANLDECVHDIEKEEKLEIVEDHLSIESSVSFDEEIFPRASIEAVDISLLKEKEMYVEITANSGDANVDGNGKENLEREFQKEEGSEESNLVNLCQENNQPVPVTEKSLPEPPIEIMSQSDVDLASNALGKYVEKSSIPVENCILIISPRASIEAVDISLLKEKEMNVEIPSGSGEINVDGNGLGNLEREFEKDEGSKESNLVNLCKENKQPVHGTEKSKDLPEPFIDIMSQSHADMTNNKLGKSVEKSSIPVENWVLITEEATQGCKASHEISETLVGVNDAPFHGRVMETEELSPDTEKTELLKRNEVGHSPLIVRRATLWNCCGLLEVLTTSDRDCYEQRKRDEWQQKNVNGSLVINNEHALGFLLPNPETYLKL